jgi:MoxR-like ATPase
VHPDFKHPGQRRSVVLIDEIDKAPRDVPNDILNEIDDMSFTIPELENAPVGVEPKWRPLVFITSNSEKGLPDAFLRRCVYYHMPFPAPKVLLSIVESRVGKRFSEKSLLGELLAIFHEVRSKQRALRKPPGIAELLMWLSALPPEAANARSIADVPTALTTARSTLFKTREDLELADKLLGTRSNEGAVR